MLVYSFCSLRVEDVGEVEREDRVDKTLENEWHEVLRVILKFLPFFVRCGKISPIDHSATRLQKLMKVSRISTQFSCPIEVFDDQFLRLYFLLVLGLDPAVGLAPGDLPIFWTGDSLMRLLCDNQVEKPLVHCSLNYPVVGTSLICIANIRLSSVYPCGLLVLFRPFLCTWSLSNQFFSAILGILDLSRTDQGCL